MLCSFRWQRDEGVPRRCQISVGKAGRLRYNHPMRQIIMMVLLGALAISTAWGQTTPLPRFQVPDLNGRSTLLITPELTSKELLEGADGTTIALRLIIDTEGNVTSADCSTTCPPSIKATAEKAARDSKFKPLIVSGVAVPYFGTLHYTFAYGRVNWFSFGTSLKSVYLFDNISLGPPAAQLTPEFGEEKARLIELDRGVPLETRWSVIRDVIKSIKGKLKPREAWLFDLGLTLRDVTFIIVLSGPTDRDKLQKAFEQLGPLARSAPPEIPADLVKEIKEMSVYTVPRDVPEQELRQTVRSMAMKIRPGF